MRKFLSLVLALAMAMSLVVVNTSAKEFTDSDDLNYKEAVDVISEIGVVDGYTDGSFNPQGGLTRGAAAKIICNLILGPTTAAELRADTRPFSDVAVDSEFAGYIAYCAQQGIISGYADGEFKAANPLTGYAFMKMLLGALGYSTDIENYVGENWSINVAKQAIGIGLNQGLVDEFNGVDYVTREEAALYAFNTLKATLVDYDNTISANVNGAEVVISNNTAKPVTWSEGINEDGNIKDDGFVQFAEEYFPDLVRNDDETKFMEPANTWVYAKTEIGTYERLDLLVESYTTGVSGREIYDLLKAGVIKENDLEVYLDGVDNYGDAAGEIEKDDLVRSHTDDLGSTGNGVLTKVYLDTDKELITIVSINTWLAQATTDYSESNEYAVLRVYNGVTNDKKTATFLNYNVDVEDVPNVVDVTDGTFYQVTISKKDVTPNGEIVTLADVEILEDSTITEYSSSDGNKTTANAKVTKLTTGGEEYSANEKAFYDDEILYQYDMDLLTDATYNVYLDQYGYFLGVDLFEGTKNYVFITGFDRNSSNLAVKTATAGAIFLDGTMENIEVNINATDDNIEDARKKGEDNADRFIEWSTLGYDQNNSAWDREGKFGRNGIYNLNQWYTYTVNDAGVYTLKPCVRMTWTHYPLSADDTIIRTDNLFVDDGYDVSGYVYGEDASVYLTVDLDVVDTTDGIQKAVTEVTGVYTGVQSVDLVINTEDPEARDEGQVFTVFDSDGYIIAAVVVGEAQGATGNYAYVLSQAKSEGRQDGYYYWTFEAILEGEKQTLTARSSYSDTIRNLTVGEVVELRFDGDYVVNVKAVDNGDIWGNDQTASPAQGNLGVISTNIDGEDVYLLKGLVDNVNVVSLQRNTLYVTGDRSDVGLGIARDAKAVVIQDENQKTNVVTNFPDVESAVNYLVDPYTNTSAKEYKGTIMAVLNSSGAAEWVVFDSATPLVTGSDAGYGQVGDNVTASAWVDTLGYVHAIVNYNRPAYVPASDNVAVSFQVYANGQYVGTIADNMGVSGGGVGNNQYNYNALTVAIGGGGPVPSLVVDPNATIELRNVTVTPQNIIMRYVDAAGNLLGMTTANPATVPYGVATAVNFRPDPTVYTAGTNFTYKVDGVKTAVNGSGTVAASPAPATSITVNPTGKDYVDVVITGLTTPAAQYDITTFNWATLWTLDSTKFNATDYPNDFDSTIQITPTALTVNEGTPVTFTVTYAGDLDDAEAYRVVIAELGVDAILYDDDGTGDNLSTSVVVTPTDDINITAADVTVTPVDLAKLTSVTFEANSVTLNFVGRVDVAARALSTTAPAVVTDKTADNVTSITYQVTNTTLVGGETFTVDLSKITGAQYSGNSAVVLKTDGTIGAGPATVTLVAGGTATLA